MEPELGLGIVTEVEGRFITLRFPASRCERKYAAASAPLRRIRFNPGDILTSRDGSRLQVESVRAVEGLLHYAGGDTEWPESELSDDIGFTAPLERLNGAFFDRIRDFELRCRVWRQRHRSAKSRVRGFIGARIDLIPHQIYVAHQVSSRLIPRVLLSDEIGLGKTIEASLVLHRLLVNERIGRVLILVPQSLIHQWFVELLRRFNLAFRIFDADYCESCAPDVNPFLEDQLGLAGIDFLSGDESQQRRAVEAGWDMLVIDEAHHLSEESAGYRLAEALGRVSLGVMLLTATPEQLGRRSHFSRLRLLDPARYFDYEQFENEENEYEAVARLADKLLDKEKADNSEIAELLDRYGTGRAVFRNTRGVVPKLPKRRVHLVPLPGRDVDLKRCTAEHTGTAEPDYSDDPRIDWLAGWLRKHGRTKVLLICRTAGKAVAISEALRKRIRINIALFHQGMTLLQRDRSASWFSESDGARILICSEIGSEGRNFQFCHHLVLYDLPLNPELLEQRIGRLDRIGQSHTVNVHVPYVTGSENELLARWYQEGLNAFERIVPGVYQIHQQLGGELDTIVRGKRFSDFENFCLRTTKQRDEIAARLRTGRDRLLELHSFDPGTARSLIEEIEREDVDAGLEKVMLDLFEFYGIQAEPLAARTFRLNLELLSNPEFPLPPYAKGDLIITFDRNTALSREEIEFCTRDHPMVTGLFDLHLGSEKGNCTLAFWPDEVRSGFVLEIVYILECLAPSNLNTDRFLPSTPIRVVVDQDMVICTDAYPADFLNSRLLPGEVSRAPDFEQVQKERVPRMVELGISAAETEAEDRIGKSIAEMEAVLGSETRRLTELRAMNANISDQEISSRRLEIEQLRRVLLKARLRMDAIRLIFRGGL